MQSLKPATIALMMSIILWGTLLGGIVYSNLIFMPVYLSDLPASAVLITGPYALHEESFWLLIHPLLIVSLIITAVMNWKVRSRRTLIGLSVAVYAAVIVTTALYFVPELLDFARSAELSVSREEWTRRTGLWQTLSWVRGVIMYCGIVPLLLAFSKQTDTPESR